MIFDKALQNRDKPRNSWPKKIMGQSVNIRLMNTVEDFYGLEESQEHEDQYEDYFEDQSEPGLSAETAALLAESLEDHTSVNMVSVKVKNAKVNCNCTCKCSKSDEITDSNEIVKVTNRRVNVSP